MYVCISLAVRLKPPVEPAQNRLNFFCIDVLNQVFQGQCQQWSLILEERLSQNGYGANKL